MLPVVFETTNSRTHGSLYFVETMNIGATELMYLVVYTFLTLFWCFEKYGRYWKNQNISFFFYFFGMCYFLKTWIGEERNWIQDECFSIVYTMYYIFIIILMFWQIWRYWKNQNILLFFFYFFGELFCWILNRGRKKLNSRWVFLDVYYIFNIILLLWQIWTLLDKSKHIILLLL